MSDPVLLYGAPDALPDLFHAIPVGIIDAFLYGESDGHRFATVSSLDSDKVAAFGVEVLDPYTLGADELLASGIARHLYEVEIALRACQEVGIDRALVPSEFPLGVADHLRKGGVALEVAPETFVARRRDNSSSIQISQTPESSSK